MMNLNLPRTEDISLALRSEASLLCINYNYKNIYIYIFFLKYYKLFLIFAIYKLEFFKYISQLCKLKVKSIIKT